MARRFSEQETVVVFDPETGEWSCWTDVPRTAKRWKALGWPVAVAGRVAGSGEPRSWAARVPERAVRFGRPAGRKASEAQRSALAAARTARTEAKSSVATEKSAQEGDR
jgi:hypothetical protein